MAEIPTEAEILAERASINDYLPDGVPLSDFIDKALLYVKRYLRNVRGIEWSTVFVGTDYLTDSDGNANNQDQLIHAITLTTISLVYKEYSQTVNESQWWDLYMAYRDECETLLNQAKLDIDIDESGGIDSLEEKVRTQTFFKG